MRNSIFILVLLFSCSPEAQQHRKEQKLARLVKENPNLVSRDTTFIDTTFKSSEVHETFEGQMTPDLWPVDSLTAGFKERVDSTDLDSLNRGFKKILTHANDMDTTFKSKNSKIRIKKEGKNITVDVDIVPDPVKAVIPVAVTNINPPAVLTWYESFFLYIGKIFGKMGFCLLLILIIYITYRVIRHFTK
jgi:hypothetical protein